MDRRLFRDASRAPFHGAAAARDGFRAETREATRGSGYLLGTIGIVAVAAWAGMDLVLQPANAKLFIILRVACAIGMGALCLMLRTPVGARRPEPIVLGVIALPQAAIAVMISHLTGAYGAYATGFSLAIYASAFLLIWRWTYTAALIGFTWLALAVALMLASRRPGAEQLVTVCLYLATASALGLAGQWYRSILARQAFESRAQLETEQARNRELVARLERLSHQDELTGLANRRSWDEALGRAVGDARGHARRLAVALCDLDHFKRVNDEYGHQAGDRVLREAGALLIACVRDGDLVARLGGDEFAVLFPGTGEATALALAARIAQRSVWLGPGADVGDSVSFSIGVAELAAGDRSIDDLMARADAHLYLAKRRRGSVCGAQAA